VVSTRGALGLAGQDEVKQALKEATGQAVARGVFGAPTCFVGEQMFFGQDRLDFVEEALAGQQLFDALAFPQAQVVDGVGAVAVPILERALAPVGACTGCNGPGLRRPGPGSSASPRCTRPPRGAGDDLQRRNAEGGVAQALVGFTAADQGHRAIRSSPGCWR
jgi:hypothetical protein